MKKIKLLVIGYSKFAEKRLIKSIKKIKKIDYRICSKTKTNSNINYNNYLNGLQFNPDLIYISLTNHLHYRYTKLFLKKGYNVIVDKPITESLQKTNELIKIAKSKKLLLSEATLFHYHKVFHKILKIIGGKNKLQFLQSHFNIPQVKSIKDINGEALVVSQFTLAADTSRGNRPGFSYAAHPEKGEKLYEYFTKKLQETDISCKMGVFGGDMMVSLINDGPTTIWLDNKD